MPSNPSSRPLSCAEGPPNIRYKPRRSLSSRRQDRCRSQPILQLRVAFKTCMRIGFAGGLLIHLAPGAPASPHQEASECTPIGSSLIASTQRPSSVALSPAPSGSSSIWVQRRRSTNTKNLSTHLKTHLFTETGIYARMNAHALLRRSHMGVKRLLEKYAVCGGGGISRR
jgi:hypothetical protein